MRKVLFPNLNGVRFVAAFMVVIHHIEQLKSIFGFGNFWTNSTILVLGELGVTLFFVLSGFLITYLLIDEKHGSGSVSLSNFYVRRILRIWPLYFWVVALAFFILPKFPIMDMPPYTFFLEKDFNLKLAFFALFLPNVAYLVFPPVPYASQGWSIGVEEQFYLIWPIIIKSCRNVWVPMVTIIGGISFVKLLILFKVLNFSYGFFTSRFVYAFLEVTRIDCMSIGGLAAYLVYNNVEKVKTVIYSKYLQTLVYAVVALLVSYGVRFKYFNQQIYALLFCIIIVNLACNADTILSINNKAFDYLGKISYGLYMYHPLCIVLSLLICRHLQKSLNMSGYALHGAIFVLSVVLTTVVSAASYKFFEEFFIRRKVRFSYVVSGENAK